MKQLFFCSIILGQLILSSCHKAENQPYVISCSNTTKYEPANFDTSDNVSIFCPNAFTPNGYGEVVNERFYVVATGLKSYSIQIFSSNDLVYESQDIYEAWDGSVNGNIQKGSYSYIVTALTKHNETVKITGNLISFDNKEQLNHCEVCQFPDQIIAGHGFILPTEEYINCVK